MTEATFVDLVTYKRDGTAVSTPMLAAVRDGALLLRTHHTAGKLKRLRANNTVEVAPVRRGKHIGPVARGTASVVPATETVACLELFHRRHGLLGRLATWVRHARGWRDVFVEVRVL